MTQRRWRRSGRGLASPNPPLGQTNITDFLIAPAKSPAGRQSSAVGTPLQLALKRALDLSVALTATVVLAPLLAILAIIIRVESSGPILFSQERLGRGGRTFRIYKFRSMTAGAERQLLQDEALRSAYLANAYKIPANDDPRVTKLGGFLRRTSLDEVPQLINVLRGEMSLVGPRPVLVEELERYGPHAAAYLDVKPGLTGIWQVSGRSAIDYPERAELDRSYRETWSLRLDLKIMLRTIPAVLGQRGAY